MLQAQLSVKKICNIVQWSNITFYDVRIMVMDGNRLERKTGVVVTTKLLKKTSERPKLANHAVAQCLAPFWFPSGLWVGAKECLEVM